MDMNITAKFFYSYKWLSHIILAICYSVWPFPTVFNSLLVFKKFSAVLQVPFCYCLTISYRELLKRSIILHEDASILFLSVGEKEVKGSWYRGAILALLRIRSLWGICLKMVPESFSILYELTLFLPPL